MELGQLYGYIRQDDGIDSLKFSVPHELRRNNGRMRSEDVKACVGQIRSALTSARALFILIYSIAYSRTLHVVCQENLALTKLT